ncbi:MAG: carbohydrate kinase family protein [Hadesarchaea archaeon]|nr:carbohydrate kinase family protein [Hadesarchaea archaeon]
MRPNIDVVAVGNLNVDLICKVSKLPREDEKLLADEFVRSPGGGAANFAVACSKLGLQTGFIGCVGDDDFGKWILEDLKRNDVDTSRIKIVAAPTGLVLSLSTRKGEHFLIAHRGANLCLKPEDLDQGYLRSARLVHASSVVEEVAKAVGSRARELGILASLDVGAELSVLGRRKLLRILELFDICFMNRRAYRNLFGDMPSRASLLRNFPVGLKVLVVTLGPKGAAATDGEGIFLEPAYRVEVRDTTGAGDAFAAAFDAVWMKSGDVKRALTYAVAEAAIKVQHVGSREGLPTMEELEKFIRTHER